MTNEELVDRVAVEVMGWHKEYYQLGTHVPRICVGYKWFDENNEYVRLKNYPHTDWTPLTDMNDCWMVVQRMIEKGFEPTIDYESRNNINTWHVSFYEDLHTINKLANPAILQASLEAVKE